MLMAACYASGTFLQMQRAELTEEEIREVTAEGDRVRDPLSPRSFDLATLLLLVENSKSSRDAIREGIHHGESSISDDELWELGYFVEHLMIAVRCNQGLGKYLDLARRAVNTFTVEERRAAVLEVLWDAEGGDDDGPRLNEEDARFCIQQLSRYEKRLGALDPVFTRDLLQRMDLSDNPGGKWPDGSARIGPSRVAAKLAISVGAFEDTNERNSKAAFDHAWEVDRRKFAEQQKEARQSIAERERRNRRG
jgi:hypothetical protein